VQRMLPKAMTRTNRQFRAHLHGKDLGRLQSAARISEHGTPTATPEKSSAANHTPEQAELLLAILAGFAGLCAFPGAALCVTIHKKYDWPFA
jgi:hypothetical protein